MEKQKFLKDIPIFKQILLGLLCAALNYGIKFLSVKLEIPLFMDSIFTIFASFFGWTSGFLCALLFHLAACAPAFEISGLLFTVCSFSIVVIVRVFFKKAAKTTFAEFLAVYLIIAFVISLEGAVISTFAISVFDYKDDVALKDITLALMRQKTPLLLSSFLARLPVNLVDKAIAVIVASGDIYIFRIARCKNKNRQP